MHVRATGDIHIDDHHTNEDVAFAIGTVNISLVFPFLYFMSPFDMLKLDNYSWDILGCLLLVFIQALLQVLGDRKGINRFGDFSASLDEALIHVSLVGRLY